jgi:hypothetical protein
MTDARRQASTGCPPAPQLVIIAGRNLVIARTGTAAQVRTLGPLELLPRPWLPHTCHPRLLRDLLQWLDDVTAWLNHDYTWKVTRPIPDCWPEHPHIVHELAVLAWLRLVAGDALDPGPIEDWHRYALPSFFSRLAERLGNGCATKHDPWPGAPRHAGYRQPDAVQARQEAFHRMVREQQQAWDRGGRTEQPEQLQLDEPPDLDPPDEETGYPDA